MSPHGGSFILITTLHSSATVVQTTAIVLVNVSEGFVVSAVLDLNLWVKYVQKLHHILSGEAAILEVNLTK